MSIEERILMIRTEYSFQMIELEYDECGQSNNARLSMLSTHNENQSLRKRPSSADIVIDCLAYGYGPFGREPIFLSSTASAQRPAKVQNRLRLFQCAAQKLHQNGRLVRLRPAGANTKWTLSLSLASFGPAVAQVAIGYPLPLSKFIPVIFGQGISYSSQLEYRQGIYG